MTVMTTLAADVPSTPLGPFQDSAVAWTTWSTLMGFVGVVTLAALASGPAASALGAGAASRITTRLARAAALLGLLAVPAVLSDLAHDASRGGGYDYASAWGSLFDGSTAGLLAGLEVTLAPAGAALLLPLALPRRRTAGPRRRAAGPRSRSRLLGAGLAASAVALVSTKFPAEAPDDWPRTVFGTLMWMLHLLGGAVWIGGLAGLLLLALPGGVPRSGRRVFFSALIRRFSVTAMSCVAAITLSGLFLYWEHVDGPSQLLSTMYGRVLGVKILLFGGMVLLGAANQFWLHPRIEALRAAGDDRPLHVLLARRFPGVLAVELLLGLSLLFVAPFLHGSARNQSYQAAEARHRTAATAGPPKTGLPRIGDKRVSASTWVWGGAETVLVVVVLAAGYRASGRLARSKAAAARRGARGGTRTRTAHEAREV